MNKDKLIWADNLRALATVSVVILHVSAPLVPRVGYDTEWWIGNIFEGSTRFCVPIFFMLTGALLLGKDHILPDFFKKRFVRVIIPFFFWSLPYIAFNLALRFKHGESLSLFSILNYILNQYRHGSFYHLWFIYVLIGLYLFIPFLAKGIKNCSNSELVFFLIIWCYTLLLKYPFLSVLDLNLTLSYFSGFLGYLVLGYYLSRITFKSNKHKDIIGIILFLIGTSVSIFGTYILSKGSGKLDELYYEYLTPNVAMSSIGVFLFFKDKLTVIPILVFLNTLISKFSYGIYLIHVLVLIVLYKLNLTCDFINPIIGIFTTTISCLSLSILILYLVKKLPLGKHISG